MRRGRSWYALRRLGGDLTALRDDLSAGLSQRLAADDRAVGRVDVERHCSAWPDYAPACYTYAWSKALAVNLLTRFRKAGCAGAARPSSRS